MRHALVVRVGHKVHEVFFEVGTCAGNDVHFALTDHFGKRAAQLCGAHGPGQGHHHFAPFGKVRFVAFGSIYQRCCVEMPVMFFNELRNGSACHAFQFGREGRERVIGINLSANVWSE